MMGNPENSPPARPRTVPEGARWDPKDPGFEWVTGGVDEDGRRHGAYRSWTREGVLHGESNYVHGKVHGKNINFHPDGTVASQADWVMGLILDSQFYRSDSPTTEPFAQANAAVWSVRYCTRDGKTNYTIRYFMRDGTECGPDGNQLPPRPTGVSPDARWFPDMDRWVEGAIERGTNNQVGRWRWWSSDGVLRHEETRDASGHPVLISQYEPDGTLKKKTTRSAQGDERDYYFSDGKLSTRYREDTKGRQTYKASWLRDGVLDEECERTFDGDTLTSVVERGRGGVLAFEARREGPGLACVLYHDDGTTIAATGLIENEKLVGTWRLLDNAGVLCREVDTSPFAVEQRPTAQGLLWELGHALYRSDEPAFATPDELVGVDDEPWADTPGCFDEHVTAFPRLLRGLISADPLVRQYCLGAIEYEIEHQGSTYPATALVIPWLARLLSHRDAERTKLLSTIQIAGQNAAPFIAQVNEMPVDDPERYAIEGTCQAIGKAWPDIFACFAKATPLERRMIFVLAKLAPQSRANIIEVARTDADPAIRACAIDSLTSLDGYNVAEVTPCLADKDALVRAAAAIAIALSKGPEAPREVVATVREAVHGFKDLAARWRELPYADGHVLGYLALAAGAVRSADARSLVQALCERIDEVDGRSAVMYGQGLLALAFGRGELPFAKRFIEILDALARSKQFWMLEANAHEVLAKWSLPTSRDALVKLVAEVKVKPSPESWLYDKMHAA